MPFCVVGGTVVVRLNCDGEPFPSYKAGYELLFVIDAGYIPEDGKDVSLEYGGREEKFTGEGGKGYSARISQPSGTFHFRVRSGKRCSIGGTIQVPPCLQIKGQPVTPDHIVLQTLVSKWMGPMREWQPHLKAASQAGYNMIHFTPLQRRGHSNSPYSIYNHLELDPDLFELNATTEDKMTELRKTVEWMEKDLGMLSLIDVVWNHTACDSPWLADHPEAGYNLENSPHLKIAYDLDESILKFSSELESVHGQDPIVAGEEDVQRILEIFEHQVLPESALWEYFVVDVSKALMELEAAFRREAATSPKIDDAQVIIESLDNALFDDGKFDRNSHRMSIDLVKAHYRDRLKEYRRTPNERDRSLLLSRVLSEYRLKLDQINYPRYQQYDEKVQQILKNLSNRVTYERVAEHGPKLGSISEKSPLVPTYFTRVERTDCSGNYAFANNGWIWNADPLLNFAESPSDAYFTREVIVWGDCVKLRYGNAPEDSPWLWGFMRRYTELMASIFHGFRIDNCHSTPLHVAEGLLGAGREQRPNLYVCAELFTGSEDRDLTFVTRLGIDSLIREAMVSWDAAELGRTTARYGGQPSASPFDGITMMLPSQPHALYMDCTHDNEMPAQRRTVEDSLSNSAIVATSTAAIGSTRGYDELVPKHLNLVNEKRQYPIPDCKVGLWKLRRELNLIHKRIIDEGMTEIATSQDHDMLVIKRTNPQTMASIILFARTAFGNTNPTQIYGSVLIERYDVATMLSARILVTGPPGGDTDHIPTIPSIVEIGQAKIIEGMALETLSETGLLLEFKEFTPGSIIFVMCTPKFQIVKPLQHMGEIVDRINKLDLVDLNILLYRCAEEENDGPGTYQLPGYGALAYSGLQGFYSIVKRLIDDPNQHCHLCENVKNGDWALDYICNRLDRKMYPRLTGLHAALKPLVEEIKSTVPELKPRLFIELVSNLWQAATNVALQKMGLSDQSELVKALSLTSVQLVSSVSSTGLDPTKPDIPCLSAGLPHFSTHHMRCWGRDIFISLPGLLLRTNRFEDAKRHLLSFAACYYRGLIPNLLDSGRRPRYNSRDATWFFLYSLQRYCKAVKSLAIMDTLVPMRFPNDIYVDYDDPTIFTRSKKLAEIVQDIMQAHASGIEFREWNAGPALDSVMRNEGFNIKVGLEIETGFIYGGNQYNCGTWMDKMGESERAGNRGVPSTPRDGSAIEIIALLASALDWLVACNPTGKSFVTITNGQTLTFTDWRDKIQANFEKHFYIPSDRRDDAQFEIDEKLVGRRGIYKDTYKATFSRGDYQLRPNMVVAISIAPWLFTKERASKALLFADTVLLGPLGMRTLDPEDLAYRPNYDNSSEVEDPTIARGANYHQGPEWLWPVGCHLRALLHFFPDTDSADLFRRLCQHWRYIQNSDWAGLPELTNQDGAFCRDSCTTQAWSSATLLDALLSLE